jgi:hypothetical protein
MMFQYFLFAVAVMMKRKLPTHESMCHAERYKASNKRGVKAPLQGV